MPPSDPSEEEIAKGIADQISRGLVSYERAKKQLLEQGSRPKNTINVGCVIEWLDKHVRRVGYEEEPDENGVIRPLDHSGYYSGGNESGANMLESARQNALEAKAHPNLVARPGQPTINMAELNAAQERAIDVTGMITALNARADEELGVIDAE